MSHCIAALPEKLLFSQRAVVSGRQRYYARVDCTGVYCLLAQIEYINLTYTCSGMDVHEMREFLDDIGASQCKIIAKVLYSGVSSSLYKHDHSAVVANSMCQQMAHQTP